MNLVKDRGNLWLRRADRVLGTPLLMALGLRTKRDRPATIRKIGLLKTAAIGDTLLLAGLARDLAAAFPGAELVLVTGNDNATVGPLLKPPVHEHIRISVHRPWSAVRRLQAERFDLLIDCGSWPRVDALIAGLSGARWRVGFQTPGQSRHYAYDMTVQHSSAVHEADNYRRLGVAIGAGKGSPPRVTPPGVVSSDRLPGEPYVVFHPWAGGFRGELREWPSPNWVELARRVRDLGVLMVSGSAAESGQSALLVAAIQADGVRAESIAGRFSIVELADVLHGARAVVSVNTGIMHLAALVGSVTVSLNGPTNGDRWGPVGERAASVTPRTDGCGYLNLGFEYDGQRTDCMEHIEVRDVERVLRELLKEST